MAIVTGILVCAFSKKKRWLLTVAISAMLISMFYVLAESNSNEAISSDRISALVGSGVGFSLVAGSIGFWIGSLIFKGKADEALSNSPKSDFE